MTQEDQPETGNRRRNALAAVGFLFLGMLVMAFLHDFKLADPSKYHRDLTQSPHWAAYHHDAFPEDDLLRRYGHYNESPLQNLIYWAGTRFMDLVAFNKWVGIVIFGITTALFFLLGSRMAGLGAGILAACFFMIFPRGSYETAGGFSKAWAIGFVLLAVYAVEKRDWKHLVWAMPLATLAYPVSPVLMGGIVSAGLVLEFFRDRKESFRGLAFLAAGSALALIPLLYKYFIPPDFIGDMVSSSFMNELYAKGYSTEPPDPIWEEVWYYLDDPFFYILTPILIATLFIRNRPVWRRSWTALLVGSAVFYLIAHALVPRLYLPDRYTRYTMAVFLVLFHAVNWDRRLRTKNRGWIRPAGAAAVVVLAAVMFGDTFKPCDGKKSLGRWEDRGTLAPVSTFIARLPQPVFIAGHPEDTADVMLQARRPVLTIHRMFHHWFEDYRNEIDTRQRDILRAFFARDPAEVDRLADLYGVTHFLVRRNVYQDKKYRSGNVLYRKEYLGFTQDLARGPKTFVLNPPPKENMVYQDSRYTEIKLPISGNIASQAGTDASGEGKR